MEEVDWRSCIREENGTFTIVATTVLQPPVSTFPAKQQRDKLVETGKGFKQNDNIILLEDMTGFKSIESAYKMVFGTTSGIPKKKEKKARRSTVDAKETIDNADESQYDSDSDPKPEDVDSDGDSKPTLDDVDSDSDSKPTLEDVDSDSGKPTPNNADETVSQPNSIKQESIEDLLVSMLNRMNLQDKYQVILVPIKRKKISNCICIDLTNED